MTHPDTRERRRERGDFIRACRERLGPAEIGLPAGGRRRTPGLRREEVAQLGGLSTTWYSWLEQGRDISLSPAVLARLAGALRLTRAERTYLFELSGCSDPNASRAETRELPQGVQSCVEAIVAPAYILDRGWNALAWNQPAQALFVGWLDGPREPNLLRYIFRSEAARTLIRDHETRARRVVAEFRADVGTHIDEPGIRRLIDELRHESASFARLWDNHAVIGREGGRRVFDHPTAGPLAYDQISFNVASDPALKLTMLLESAHATPPTEDSDE